MITGDQGRATIDLALADSITNWRMNVDAVSAAGKLGSTELGIGVFQGFFVALDFSVTLTRNDEVSIPVNRAIIDLVIPPGFQVDTTAFQLLAEAKLLAKYELTGNQVILYVCDIEPLKPLRFTYQLKALYPIRAQIPPLGVYEYYKPANKDRTSSVEIVIINQMYEALLETLSERQHHLLSA